MMRLLELDMQDLADARKRESDIATSESAPLLNKIVSPILALVIVGLTFALFYMIMFKGITTVEKDILIYVLGALTSYVGMVLSYYFGSSNSSKHKDEAIKELMKR
jgi:ABC-type siderophore export system fused ATPase/permease subunit